MAESLPHYNLAAIRDLLLAAFSPQELLRFLQDRADLRPVLKVIGPDTSLNGMVDEVIDYCRRYLLLDMLLYEVKVVNPRQYDRFEPRLGIAPEGLPPQALSELREQPGGLFEAGLKAHRAGDLETAQNLLLESYAEAEAAKDREGMARSALALGQVLHERGDLEEAAQYLQNSKSQFQWLRDRAGLARCLLALGLLARDRGDLPQARSDLGQALKSFGDLDDREMLVASLTALAQLAGQQGDRWLAGENLQQAASLLRQEEDRHGAAQGLLALGRQARDVGLLELATTYLEESLSLWTELGEESRLAETELLLGQVGLDQGRPNAAAPHVEHALMVFQNLDIQAGVADSSRALGRIALARGDLNRAEEFLRESRDLSDRLEDETGLVESLLWLSVLDYQRGDYRWALDGLDQVLARDPQNAEAYAWYGRTQLASGNPSAAVANFDRAIELDPAGGPWFERAECYAELGHFPEAVADLERFLQQNPDDELAQQRLGELRQAEGKVETVTLPEPVPSSSLVPEEEAGRRAEEENREIASVPVVVPSLEPEAKEEAPDLRPESEPRTGGRIWIVVAKPEQFSWDDAFQDFADDPDRPPIGWTGVSQPASQNRLKQARPGDHVLAYVSTSPVSYITGLAEIVKGPYDIIPDPSEPEKKRSVVDIVPKSIFPQGVTLHQLLEHVPTLEKAKKTARISFSEVKPHEWAVIRRLILEANPDAGLDELLPAAPPQEEAEGLLEPSIPSVPGQVHGAEIAPPEPESELFVPQPIEAVPEGGALTGVKLEDLEGPAPEPEMGPGFDLSGAAEPLEGRAVGDGTVHTAEASLPPGISRVEEPPAAEMPDDLKHLQVDAAAPERVQVDKAFALAVWVRRPSQARLDAKGLEQVETGDVYVEWPEEQTYVQLRVEVSAPECEIDGEASQTFRMPRRGEPPVFRFHLTPRRPGEIGIIVRVYQQDDCLGTAQVSTKAEDREVGQVEVRVVSQAVPIIVWGDNPPPPPPARDHWLTIEVGPQLVTLRLPDQDPYCSPIELDHDALRDAEITAEDRGQILFKGIIHTDGYEEGGFQKRSTYDGYKEALERSGGRLRVALSLAPGLRNYPWECLKDRRDDVPLTVSEKRPFYRLHGGAHRDPVPARPLRFLFALCNPRDLEAEEGPVARLPGLEVAKELEIIHLAMKELVDDGLASYRILERSSTGPVTREAVTEELRADGGYHVLHLLAHGGRRERRDDYALVMENRDGNHDFVYPANLHSTMFEHGLRLVVLSACDSAVPVSATALKSLALQLVDKGVPAVIAMQQEWPVQAAQVFTQRFYGDLARTGRVDMALAATRYDLYDLDAEGGAWAIPQLVMSRHDGLLFEVDTLRASTLRRPKTHDLDVRDYAGLGAEDPTPRRAARAIEEQLRAYGYGSEPIGNAVRAVLAPHLARRPAEPEPLAAGQRREDLLSLAPQVTLHSAKLQAYVEQEHQLKLPPSTYTQIASALNAGKHIILIGAPGTGKTSLAQAVCEYASDPEQHHQPFTPGYVLTTATADWTTFDTVGGYVPTQEGTLQFRPGIFLEAVSAARWLIIDEINRAEIDKAFGELFTLLSGQGVHLPYKVRGQPVRILPPARLGKGEAQSTRSWIPPEASGQYDYVMHPNWRIVGTMNVYDKSTLFQMSFAFMRRFAFVDVDPPADRSFFRLVDQWLDEQGVPAHPIKDEEDCAAWDDCTSIQQHFRRLLHLTADPTTGTTGLTGDNRLMELRMMGPAIVKDMIEYIGERHRIEQDEDKLHEILGEALLLYVVPQLDGLDYHGIHGVYNCVKDRFETADIQRSILDRLRLLYPHVHDLEPDTPKEQGGRGL